MYHRIGPSPFRKPICVLVVGMHQNNFLSPPPVRPLWVVPHEETMHTVKLVVIGSSGVGKTSFRTQVCP